MVDKVLNPNTAEKIDSDFVFEIKDRLEKSKIPSQREREDILNMAQELQMNAGQDEGMAKTKETVEKFIRLKEEKYYDQRSVFKDKGVLNKSFVKEITKNQILDGNTNMMRISIDVEGLKTVNDIMGHEAGDKYLLRVYEQLEKSINDIKKNYKEDSQELEFFITAEGGDEFGILVVGKKDIGIDLSTQELKLSEKDESQKTLGTLINEKLNDNLGDIETESEGILNKEKVVQRFKGVYEKRFEKYLKNLQDDLKNQEYLDRRSRRYEKELLEISGKSSLEEIRDEKKIEIIIQIAREQHEKKLDEIDERFKDYKFFASASSGEATLSELLEQEKNKEFVTQKGQQIQKKNINLSIKQSEEIATMDLFFSKADRRMNKLKALFKAQAREAIELGDKNPDSELHELYLQGRNLMTHMLVLSRNDEQTELLLELGDISDENKEMDRKIKELKAERDRLLKALNECESKLNN